MQKHFSRNDLDNAFDLPGFAENGHKANRKAKRNAPFSKGDEGRARRAIRKAVRRSKESGLYA